ncbi:MAG: component of SufBCD complex [Rhodobacteraceae bacterium]|nr:component of SufBCD complex [Paracoccaceae bacterium]
MPTTILDLIDLRSFSNVWYWIFLGVTWSRVLTAPMGIPVDMLRQARGGDERAQDRLAAMTEIMVRRHLALLHGLGPVLTGGWAFVLSALVILSVGYGVEFAQALLLLVLPLAIVRAEMSRTARSLARDRLAVEDLPQVLTRMRWRLQAVGLAAVFFSAVWGMYSNLARLAL